eukprot:UC4_evm5s1434
MPIEQHNPSQKLPLQNLEIWAGILAGGWLSCRFTLLKHTGILVVEVGQDEKNQYDMRLCRAETGGSPGRFNLYFERPKPTENSASTKSSAINLAFRAPNFRSAHLWLVEIAKFKASEDLSRHLGGVTANSLSSVDRSLITLAQELRKKRHALKYSIKMLRDTLDSAISSKNFHNFGDICVLQDKVQLDIRSLISAVSSIKKEIIS